MLRDFIGTRHEGGGSERKRSAKKRSFVWAAEPPLRRGPGTRGGAGGRRGGGGRRGA